MICFLKSKQLAVFLRSCIISSIYQTLFYTNAFFWNIRKHGLVNTHMPPRTISLDRLLAFPFNGILPSATLWLVSLQQASTVWRLLPLVVRWYPAGENKTIVTNQITAVEVTNQKLILKSLHIRQIQTLMFWRWWHAGDFHCVSLQGSKPVRCPAMSMEVWGAPCEGCC